MFEDIIPGISTADLELGITVFLIATAAWQTILTRQNVRAAKESIEFLTEPLVFIDANWEDRMVRGQQHLVVKVFMKNRGGGPARDIQIVDIKNDFPVAIEIQKFSELEIVKRGIKELAPYQDMLLTRLIDRGSWRELPAPEISFEYTTVSGKQKCNSSIIPFPALATVY
jgi:hypothetical protein